MFFLFCFWLFSKSGIWRVTFVMQWYCSKGERWKRKNWLRKNKRWWLKKKNWGYQLHKVFLGQQINLRWGDLFIEVLVWVVLILISLFLCYLLQWYSCVLANCNELMSLVSLMMSLAYRACHDYLLIGSVIYSLMSFFWCHCASHAFLVVVMN